MIIHKEKRTFKASAASATTPLADLMIFGYSSKLYQDPVMAQKLDKGHLAIPWQNQMTDNDAHQLMLDRYDARHLLMDDIYATYRKQKLDLEKEIAQEESTCDLERYADLDSEEEEFLFDMDDPEDREAHIEERKQRQKRQRRMESKQDKTIHYHYDYNTADKKPLSIAQRSPSIQKIAHYYGIPLSSSIVIPPNIKNPTLEQSCTIDLIDRTAQAILQQVTRTQPLNVCEIQFQVRHCQDRQYDFLGKQHFCYPFYQYVLDYYRHKTRESSSKLSSTAGIDGLVDYGSSSDSDEEDQTQQEQKQKQKVSVQKIVLPTSEFISIIDKTAGTIAKVGLDLEQKIQQLRRNDPTFDFLKAHHVYHPYYQKKLAELSSSSSL